MCCASIEGATSALTGYPGGPAAPAMPGAPISPAEPGFPGLPSSPRVPRTPCKAKSHLGTPKCSMGCSSREGNAGGSPVPEPVGPPQGLQCLVGPVPHDCGCTTSLLSLYPTCHQPATCAGFGAFSAPRPAQGWSCLWSGHPSFLPSDITQCQPTEQRCKLQLSHLQASLEALEDPGLLLCPEIRRMLSSVVIARRHRAP